MKNMLIIILSLSIYSCAVNPSILSPVNDPLRKKLHTLKIGLGEGDIIRTEYLKTITVQSDFATVLEKGLPPPPI
mgnify:CR=1 FL=1